LGASKNQLPQEVRALTREIDNPRSLAAAIWLGIVGSAVLLVLPVFVGALMEDRGFSSAQAGWIGSADLTGFALASIVAYRLIRRHTWIRIVLFGLTLIVAGDLISMFLTEFLPLFLVRLGLSGFGAGFVIAVAYTLLGDTKKPERNTGIYFSFNVLGGAAGLYLLPHVVSFAGTPGMFLVLAVTAVSAIPVAILWLPREGAARHFAYKNSSSYSIYLVLAGIALFNFGLGGVWAFAERMGIDTGMHYVSVGRVLSVTYLVSMAGSAAAAWQADRFGYMGPYLAGMALMCIALILLLSTAGIGLFILAMALINFSWNYSLTYQFSAVFALDASGRMAVFIILVQSIGLMFGPGVAGLLVGQSGYSEILLLGIVTAALSASLFLLARAKS